MPVEGGVQCTLILPPNAALQMIIGPPGKDNRVARYLACFEACKKLHQMGALNDHLVPFTEDPSDNHIVKNKESSSGAGAGIIYLLINFDLFILSLFINCDEIFILI